MVSANGQMHREEIASVFEAVFLKPPKLDGAVEGEKRREAIS